MSLAQFVEQKNTISLETQLEMISLESNVVANLIETFRVTIPNFIEKLKNSKLNFSQTLDEQKSLTNDFFSKESTALSNSKHLDFLLYGDRYISVPEGFKGNLVAYGNSLKTVADTVFAVQNRVIAEYVTILASFISNKEDKISLKDHTDFFNKIKKEREVLMLELKKFSSNNSSNSKCMLKDCLTRFAELPDLFKVVKDLNNQHERTKLKAIKEHVQQCIDYLNIITNGVADGKITNISGNATANIATGAYEVAKYVEFVSVVYFDIMVYVNCVRSLIELLNKAK